MVKSSKNLPFRGISAFLLVVMIFSFSGCQNTPPVPTADVSPQQTLDRRIGLIIGLGSTPSTQGTHLLQLDNGNTIFLKSSKINLDDPIYKDKKVEVTGYIDFKVGEKANMDVQKAEIWENAPQNTNIEASWKDYSDTEKGFKIRYRDDFKILNANPGVNSVTFFREIPKKNEDGSIENKNVENQTLSNGHAVIVTFLQVKDISEFLKFLKIKSWDAKDITAGGYSQSKIGPDGLEAYKKDLNNNQNVDYYVDGRDRFYEITFQGGADDQSLLDQNVFYQMLNDFTLTKDKVIPKPGPQPVISLEVLPSTEGTSPTSSQTNPTSLLDPQSTPQSIPATDSPETSTTVIDQPENYETFVSEGFHFKIFYPKKWYYSMGESINSDVIRHYDFGPKDEEQRVGLDLYSGKIPSGTTTSIDQKTLTKVTQGVSTEIYVQGVGKRIYRLTGPSSEDTTLMNMAKSLQVSETTP